MPHTARYILPQHATLRGPHTREELYLLVNRGSMGRGEIVYDQTTKRAHRVGDLIQGMSPPTQRHLRPAYRELEGDAPWSEPASPAATRETKPPLHRPMTVGEALASRTAEEEEDAPVFPWEDRAMEHGHRNTPPLSFPKSPHGTARFMEEEDDDEEESVLERASSEQDEDEDAESDELDEEEDEDDAPAPPRCFYMGHPSWLSYGRWLVLCIICITAGVLGIEQFSLTSVAVGITLACLILCGCIIDRMHQDYVINAERVEMVWGLIGRSSKEVRIVDIRSIDVIQHGLLGFLGIGTVEFSSSGTDGVEVHFQHVRSPHKIKELVRKLQKISGKV